MSSTAEHGEGKNKGHAFQRVCDGRRELGWGRRNRTIWDIKPPSLSQPPSQAWLEVPLHPPAIQGRETGGGKAGFKVWAQVGTYADLKRSGMNIGLQAPISMRRIGTLRRARHSVCGAAHSAGNAKGMVIQNQAHVNIQLLGRREPARPNSWSRGGPALRTWRPHRSPQSTAPAASVGSPA